MTPFSLSDRFFRLLSYSYPVKNCPLVDIDETSARHAANVIESRKKKGLGMAGRNSGSDCYWWWWFAGGSGLEALSVGALGRWVEGMIKGGGVLRMNARMDVLVWASVTYCTRQYVY